MRTALTIAGSDSSAGAGIQADLKTFAAHGVYGLSVITAVTAQNTQGVTGIQEISPDMIHAQLLSLFEDIEIHSIKIGMVSTRLLIQTIARTLGALPFPPIVLDPVMISKSGYRLLKDDAMDALIHQLFPLAEVVTPNIHEAEVIVEKRIDDLESMKRAAEKIYALGAKKVVVKGGHLGGVNAIDVIYDGREFKEIESERIPTKNTHGTGCTFSSAIAANLSLGVDFFNAVRNAKIYVSGAIRNSLSLGKGCGPTHHFFDLYARAGVDHET
ncbi:MAG: bifunctional hydroxymethylpyrimidine kinase/phosphomethylpyrimidine kinase [Thermodesulfobacteriota bacterium]